jgi:undecaprenyl-diphosphatase
MKELLTSIFLGFVEGLTEFIPVSSTGHLILLIEGLNFPSPGGRVFEVFIQLGAIFAVMILYRMKIWQTITGLHNDRVAQKFTINLIIGTIPAFIMGAMFYSFIKNILYNPLVIAISLIIGGIIILLFEKKFTNPQVETVDEISPKQAFLIGCCQSIALIPGVSRSGSTIMGSLALGLNRKAAAEFSFFLAMPAMVGAVAYDIYKNWDDLLVYPHMEFMAAGFIASFITALVVVKSVIAFISKYGFAPFAWYRIALGIFALFIFL